MSLGIIILFIAIGILLIIIELLVIPGVTIAGIGGVILIAAGVFFAYKYLGSETGNYILLVSFVLSLAAVFYALRTKTWQNVGLKSNSDSHIEQFDKSKINIGDSGTAITRLAPIGKVMVNDIICEAKSITGFIDDKTLVEVIKILNNQIIVKPKN